MTRIADRFERGTTLSFEFFPPKNEALLLRNTVEAAERSLDD